ncbi:MAG: tetratricopeptide repeat protein, partial [Acidobacteriia bacterium]|nr:tetratricopeptide repeat protein [Terriglobia bacterium]
MQQADKGDQRTAKTDPVWNWKFRLLRAEILLWQGKSKESNALIDSPPPKLISGELALRTKLIQGRALYIQGNVPAAQSILAEAEQLAKTSNPDLMGEVKLAQGTLQHDKENYDGAQQFFRQALLLARQYHQPLLEAKVLGSLTRLDTAREHYDPALDSGRNALDISDSIHARHIGAITRLNVGWCSLELGDLKEAERYFNDSEKVSAEIGMKKVQQEDLNNLGRVYFNQDNYDRAKDYFQRALDIADQRGDESSAAIYLDNLSVVSLAFGHID